VDDATLDRLADLLVGFGANVQPGQIVAVDTELGKEPLTRRVVASAYRHGAKFVDVQYWDPWVKRTRIQESDAETLEFYPSWYGERILELGRQRCARIRLEGAVAPGLLADLDPERAGRDQLPRTRESLQVVGDRTTNWTIGPAPTAGWARAVYPDSPDDEALAALWRDIVHVLRLDEEDPVTAWRARQEELVGVAARLTARRFDAIRFRGPGTDLRVGLLPTSNWLGARFETVDGIVHAPNLPSEEVFTTPDPERVDGHVRATKPLVLAGTVVEGLEVRFESGRATSVDATRGAGALRSTVAKDDGAARLGEVALVDRSGRIGPLGRVFYDTLLDENAASHVALGAAYGFAVEDPADRERANTSQIHIDFMIGASDVRVDGLAPDGTETPLLRDGEWRI
jgi:aminopeptidase